MRRFLPSRRYAWFGLPVWVLAACCGWMAVVWPPAILVMVALVAVCSLFVALAIRPANDTRDRRPLKEHRLAPPEPVAQRETASSRRPFLRPEDEAEVERLYRRLKTVGRLDSKNSTDET